MCVYVCVCVCVCVCVYLCVLIEMSSILFDRIVIMEGQPSVQGLVGRTSNTVLTISHFEVRRCRRGKVVGFKEQAGINR